MSILTSFGYLEKESKIFFDRLNAAIRNSQPNRIAKISTLQYEIQYLQDYLLELKTQERAYHTYNLILSEDPSNPTKLETLPEFTVEDKASFYLYYVPKILLDSEAVPNTDGIVHTEPEIDINKQETVERISDVDKGVRFWNQKIKSTRLLIEMKFTLLNSIIQEKKERNNGK